MEILLGAYFGAHNVISDLINQTCDVYVDKRFLLLIVKDSMHLKDSDLNFLYFKVLIVAILCVFHRIVIRLLLSVLIFRQRLFGFIPMNQLY